MYLIRPIAKDDLPGLYRLAELAAVGMTSIPKNKEILAKRIEDSEIAMSREITRPTGETYQFVMEDAGTKQVIGCCCIFSKVGGFEPFYSYEIKNARHQSKMLKVDKQVPYLELKEIHDGPTEIGALFIDPAHRKKGGGRPLSLARFLYMAEHPARFEKNVLAEMRGIINEKGQPPFWEALGRHFFDVDYSIADALTLKDKKFIAELMPRHPIYIPLLPKSVQEVLGKVHELTRGALNLLTSENFSETSEIDIFEAGAILSCPTHNIRTVKNSKTAVVDKIDASEIKTHDYLLSSRQNGFRVTTGSIHNPGEETVELDPRTAELLQVEAGQQIRYVTLKD